MQIDLTGDYRQSYYDLARKFINDGGGSAERIDIIRNGHIDASFCAGKLAKLTLSENAHGNPTFRTRPWAPFPHARVNDPVR